MNLLDCRVNNQPQVGKFTRLIKSENLLLAALPFTGSLIAFAFESGFLSFYDVPLSFIQLDLVRVLTATAAVALFLGVFAILMQFVALVVQGKHPIRRALIRPFSAALVFVPLFYFIPKPNYWWWAIFVIFFASLVAIELLPPVFKRQSGKIYLERLEEQLSERRSSASSLSNDSSPAGTIDKFFLTPLGVVFFGLLIVGAMGRDLAESRDFHWVLKDSENYLLVASFGEVLVFKSYDPISKRISNEVRVLKLHEGLPVVLVRRYTGMLQGAGKKN